MPLYPALGSRVAKSTNSPASLPFVIQSLRPLSTYSLPFSAARVCNRESIGAGTCLAQCVGAHEFR